MPKVAAPAANCMGVDVEYAGVKIASYDTDKNGHLNIDNPHIARRVGATVGAGAPVTSFSHSTAPTITCKCGFKQFAAFGNECWKCRK